MLNSKIRMKMSDKLIEKVKEIPSILNDEELTNQKKAKKLLSVLAYVKNHTQICIDNILYCHEQLQLQGLNDINGVSETKETYKKIIEKNNNALVLTGEISAFILNLWQCMGATYSDLFNYCNCKPNQINEILQDLKNDTRQLTFADLVIIYNLDYNTYSGDYYYIKNYAPLSHSLRKYQIDTIERLSVKRPDVKEAIRNKIYELFPNSQDNILTEKKDCYGNSYYIDNKNGTATLKEIALPMTGEMFNRVVDDIYNVIVLEDNSNPAKIDFVNSLMNNIAYYLNVSGNYSAESKQEIEQLLNLVCPKYLSSHDICNIMNACNYLQ